MSLTEIDAETTSHADELPSVLSTRPWLTWCTDVTKSTKALRAYAALAPLVIERRARAGGLAYIDQRQTAALSGVDRKTLFRGAHPVATELEALGLMLVTPGTSTKYHQRGKHAFGDAGGWSLMPPLPTMPLLDPDPVSVRPDATVERQSSEIFSYLQSERESDRRSTYCGVHTHRTAEALLNPAATVWDGSQGDYGWRLTAILLSQVGTRRVKVTSTEVARILGISKDIAKRTLALLASNYILDRQGRSYVWDIAWCANLMERLGLEADRWGDATMLRPTPAAEQQPHRIESRAHVERLMSRDDPERRARVLWEHLADRVAEARALGSEEYADALGRIRCFEDAERYLAGEGLPLVPEVSQPPSEEFLARRDALLASIRATSAPVAPEAVAARVDPRVVAAQEEQHQRSRAQPRIPRRVSQRPRSSKPTKVCSVHDCEGRHYHKGLCEAHHNEAERVACVQQAAFQRARVAAR